MCALRQSRKSKGTLYYSQLAEVTGGGQPASWKGYSWCRDEARQCYHNSSFTKTDGRQTEQDLENVAASLKRSVWFHLQFAICKLSCIHWVFCVSFLSCPVQSVKKSLKPEINTVTKPDIFEVHESGMFLNLAFSYDAEQVAPLWHHTAYNCLC